MCIWCGFDMCDWDTGLNVEIYLFLIEGPCDPGIDNCAGEL